MDKILQLRKRIELYNHKYYILGQPVVSDFEYDTLFRELQELENKAGVIDPTSPTQRVGAPISGEFAKHTHLVKMLSLQNAMNDDEVSKFCNSVLHNYPNAIFVLEVKLDGLGLSITYEDRELIIGATRGDGVTGENVTANVRTIRNIPLRIQYGPSFPSKCEIRGEVVMRREDFECVNTERIKDGLQPFSNPRNAASGALRQQDPAETSKRHLSFYAYHLAYNEEDSVSINQSGLLRYFRQVGLPVAIHSKECKTAKEVLDHCHYIESIRSTLPYDIDGVVIKVNKFSLQEKIGFLSRTPKWAIAYKFKAQQVTTVIESIDVQVGRTGRITPVAYVTPVSVGGVVVTKSTLHNPQILRDLDVREGDTVFIERAGDVIPKIVSVVLSKRPKDAKPYPIIKHCPACNVRLVIESDSTYKCTNSSCNGRLKRALEHFVSRDAMNIKGLGRKVSYQIIDSGLMMKLHHLYTLEPKDLLSLDGFGVKSASKLYDAIQLSRSVSLQRFLYALGIPAFGRRMSDAFVLHFTKRFVGLSSNDIFEQIFNLTYDELFEIEGIGDIIAQDFVLFMLGEKNNILNLLKYISVEPLAIQQSIVGDLDNCIISITGTIDGYSRSDIQNYIENNGGTFSKRVTKSVTHLFAGESAGSKLTQAEKYSIKIIRSADVISLLNKSKTFSEITI